MGVIAELAMYEKELAIGFGALVISVLLWNIGKFEDDLNRE